MTYEYDMIVIGGGAAGLTASGMSAVLGAKTALVSSGRLGGDCTWFGCIPSKSLLKAAKVAHQVRTAAVYGFIPSEPKGDWARIMGRVHAIREQVYQDADAPPNMEKLGVDVICAQAYFLDQHSIKVTVNGVARTVTSRYFVIATGSTPQVPQFEGSDRVPMLTNESLFDLDHLPQRLLILGAGPVGIEVAQAFQRLGSDVVVVNRSARILSRDDAELAGLLAENLRSEGIRLMLGQEVERMEPGVAYMKGAERIEFDMVLSAVGRCPAVAALNLQAAGVIATGKGITVDRHCRTTAKKIFACGDVIGKYLFTHMAEHTAKVAVINAILRVPVSIDDRRVSWCTFTDPELAHVGTGEQELESRGEKYRVYRFPFSKLDRAITESEPTGLVKVFASARGRILGVSILGASAGEMIAEYALALRANIRLGTISSTIHPYPTFALGNRRAADAFVTSRLTPNVVTWIKRLFRLRGDTRGIKSLQSAGGC